MLRAILVTARGRRVTCVRLPTMATIVGMDSSDLTPEQIRRMHDALMRRWRT
jgi:hypothetical protein